MLETIDDSKDAKSKQEKAHAERLMKRIKSFKKLLDDRSAGWKQAREYADGDPNGDGDKGLVRTNLIGSMLETIQPSIYAKAPEIAVTLDESSDTSDYPLVKPFAKTLEHALNRYLVRDAKLKVRGKSAVRSALTTTVGWVKVVYQLDKKEDPLIRNRINDTQDNVQRLEALIAETKEQGGPCNEYEAKLFELQQQISGLEAQLEVVAAEGLVIDTIPTEDIIILDDSVRDVDEFMQAGAIAHRIKMTVGAFKEQFKKEPPKQAKLYTDVKDETESGTDIDGDDKLLYLYEVWSMADMTVYTLLEGSGTYVREPYQPTKLGQQWYPFFPLQLRRVDGKRYPKSTVELLIELQDEYNTRRTNSKEHRAKNIPVRLINKASGITDEELRAINGRDIHTDMIGVSADTNMPLQNQLGSLPEIPYNPQMYETSDILFDMEKVGNAQDAASGAIRVAKTATEAEIASAGMQGRTGEALDVIEDWLTDIAMYSAQLLLQNTTADTIRKHFGNSSVWPEIPLTKDEYFNLVKISIRAGSTARPNKMRERDQWIQLLPIIEGTMEKLMAAKSAGQDDVVKTIIALLDETLRRFDERLDAKALLGISEETENEQELDENGNPMAPQAEEEKPLIPPEIEQAIQDMQMQAKQQIDALTQENEQIKRALENKERDYALKEREVMLKERDMDIKETVAMTDLQAKEYEAQMEAQSEAQETAVTTELLQTNMAMNEQMLTTLQAMMQQLQEMQAPKRKQGRAVRQPDGSYVMETIEVQGE